MLAAKIGERNIWHADQLEAAARYIEETLANTGFFVSTQEFEVGDRKVRNIEAELKGTSQRGEIIVVGAHYDSVLGSPGANDNASGVAGLLEIARLLATEKVSRSVRFVAFVNEEPPFFKSANMGSRVYATRSRRRGEQIVTMLALETIGYYSDNRQSQHYPFPLGLFYPDTADFIGFVGNMSSRKLLRRIMAAWRPHTDFPALAAGMPGWLTGVDWSDHWSFWREGYPAIMITDTALFRYKYYHSPLDTPDRIKYGRMTPVVSGLAKVVKELAGDAIPFDDVPGQ